MTAHAESHPAGGHHGPPIANQSSRVDELIVSTFAGERSGWLRRDLVGRLRADAGVPVEHVVSEPVREAAPA